MLVLRTHVHQMLVHQMLVHQMLVHQMLVLRRRGVQEARGTWT
jgi:hypothetical protein